MVRADRGARAGLARVARAVPASALTRGRRVRHGERSRGRLPPLAAMVARRSARRRAVTRAPVGDGAGHDARPRRRRQPDRCRFVGVAGRVRARRDGRRAAGSVRADRAGLAAAAVASRPIGRAGLRAVPRADRDRAAPFGRAARRSHHRAVPAVVDPVRRRTRRRAPTSGTTTTRWSASSRSRRRARAR